MQIVYVETGIVRHAPVPVVPGFQLADCYHPDYVACCREAPNKVKTGWTFDGTNFREPPPPEPAPVEVVVDPVARLAAFLANNPDVAALLQPGGN